MLSPVTRFVVAGKRFTSGIGFYYRKLPGTSKVSASVVAMPALAAGALGWAARTPVFVSHARGRTTILRAHHPVSWVSHFTCLFLAVRWATGFLPLLFPLSGVVIAHPGAVLVACFSLPFARPSGRLPTIPMPQITCFPCPRTPCA
jgi:hypothetical protein